MKITQNRVFKLASNTKTLRILNYHFKDDFKALWGKKYKVVCDYTQRIRIYFGLVEAHDDIEMPLFIDGKSKKDRLLCLLFLFFNCFIGFSIMIFKAAAIDTMLIVDSYKHKVEDNSRYCKYQCSSGEVKYLLECQNDQSYRYNQKYHYRNNCFDVCSF